jgi:hypothetical protein
MLAVMFLDNLGAARGLQRSLLVGFASQIEDIRLEFLRKFKRMKFQIFDVEEHGETSAAITPTNPREHAKRPFG